MVSFRTTLWPGGGNNVGIVVPEEIVLGFGRGKRVPVVVTIDGGYTYRTTIASIGGQFLISFNAQTRGATGRTAGDEVEVTLEVDDAPRTVDPPAELAAALEAAPAAAKAWSTLSYSKQRGHAESVAGAKQEETRARRVQKVIATLSGPA
ncbi:YdeI/OmpD-associated family protein [Georgenia sp. MJ170]|uniref:YdeI/OmpD-associated family protein n=1 Tax=Georgenia sunbinii TaxID=3117728 RepID=UPI002F261FD8